MRRAKFLSIVLAASVGLALAGCQQVAQKAVEQTTGVSIDQKGDSVTVKGKDGETVNFSSEMPAELKDLPVPAGLKFDGSGSMSANGDKLAVANYKGKGALQPIVDHYQKTLPGLGWKEESNIMTDTGGLLSFSSTKSSADSLTVSFNKGEGDAVEVSLMFGKSKNTPVAKATSSAQAAAKSDSPDATPTAQPEAKPAATETPAPPKTTDASAVPAELKDIPIPSGFQPLKDGMLRATEGGKFQSAVATYAGKTGVKEAGEALQKGLTGKGWNEEEFVAGEDESAGFFTNPKDNLMLNVVVTKTDTGTEIHVQLMAQD